VGFFDLQPTPALSPFSGLSDYSGVAVALADEAPAEAQEPAPAPEPVVAAAEPAEADDEEPVAARDGREEREERADRGAGAAAGGDDDYGAGGSRTPTAAPKPAPRVDEPEEQPAPRPAPAPAPAPAPSASRTPAPAPAPAPVTPAPAPAPAPVPAPVPKPEPPPVVAEAKTKPPPAAATSDESCNDLVALEAPAMLGQLGVGRRKCLETALAGAGQQTEKKRVSLVLIQDAQARSDRPDWDRLMKRHLEDIDRSDPAMCMSYAMSLSRGGAGRASGVIRWADYALENKQKWSGPNYTKNVYNLMKLKATAANKLWEDAEKKRVEERSEANEAAAVKYRGMTKDYAREWLDFARASQENVSSPMALCVSAAGNKEFCEG
jgi:hypothetical protein